MKQEVSDDVPPKKLVQVTHLMMEAIWRYHTSLIQLYLNVLA